MERVSTEKRRFLRRSDCAAMLGISVGTFDKLLRRKENPIPSIRIGHQIIIPEDQFDKWIASESTKGVNGWAV